MLKAGAAQVDITPDLGIQLAGDIGRYRPTEEVRERLYAKALVLESGGARACLLSLDLLASSNFWSDEIRRRAAERFGLAPEAVMVHVVQNHASPTLGHFFVSDECALMPPEYPWLRGGDDRYNEPTVARILEAIERAAAAMQPVEMKLARAMDGRVAFNRRFVMRDGSARCHPPNCDPQILHVEGPTDPEVGVMLLTGRDGRPVAGLLHHTCHPCHGYPHRYVIADWPGAWAELMAGQMGVPLVINGCCGNVHHNNHVDPHAMHDHRRMGEMLAETARRALERAEPTGSTALDFRRKVLRLPLRRLKQEEVTWARRYVEEHPGPEWIDAEKTRVTWDWVYAVCTMDLRARQESDPLCDYEVQAFRIGDLALVTLMGEPFVEAQLQIKLASPARHTFVAHFCNGYAGYVPTRRAFERGGYETRTSNGSKWEPDALDAIADEAVGLVRHLF
jgi:hypothetical protein